MSHEESSDAHQEGPLDDEAPQDIHEADTNVVPASEISDAVEASAAEAAADGAMGETQKIDREAIAAQMEADAEASDADKRRQQRRKFFVGVNYAPETAAAGAEPAQLSLLGLSGNISEGGLFIASSEVVERGSMVRLEFLLPDAAETIEVDAEVRWTRDDWDAGQGVSPGFGVRFVNLSDEDRDRIQSYLGRSVGDETSGEPADEPAP